MSSNAMQQQNSSNIDTLSTVKFEQFKSLISDLQDRAGQLESYISHFVQDSTHSTTRIRPRASASHEEIEHLDWLRLQMVAASDRVARATDRANRNLGRLRNAYAPINSLPDDILHSIFSFFIALNVVPTANVCARWRKVCLAAPRLWRHLRLENDKQWDYNLSRQFVHLAGLAGHPLSVTLYSSTADSRVAKLFRSIVHLIQVLDIRSWSTDHDWFRFDFPWLESLSIDMGRYHFPCPFSLPVILNNLTTFSLCGSKLTSYRALSHYSGLTTLSLGHDDWVDDGNMLSDEPLSEVLRALPDTKCLRLHRVLMAPQEVLSLSRMPRSPSTPFIPLLSLHALHLAMPPGQLSALLRHIQTSPHSLNHVSITVDASNTQLGSSYGSSSDTFLPSPLRQILPAICTFTSLAFVFSCGVLPFGRDGPGAEYGALSTPATIQFHWPIYVDDGSSPFTGIPQRSFDNLVDSILEQGPLSEVQTLVIECSPLTITTAAQMSGVLRCVPRIRTLVWDIDWSQICGVVDDVVQARAASSVSLAPDLQLVVFKLPMLENDRLRGRLPEMLKPLAVRKVAFVGLALDTVWRWPLESDIVDSFNAQGLEILWGQSHRPESGRRSLRLAIKLAKGRSIRYCQLA